MIYIFKIIKHCFCNAAVGEVIIKNHIGFANDLLKLTKKTKGENDALEENLEAIRAFSDCENLIDYVSPCENLEILIDLLNHTSITKFK